MPIYKINYFKVLNFGLDNKKGVRVRMFEIEEVIYKN